MLLDVCGLRVTFRSERGSVPLLRGIDLQLDAGECVALVGESGSGKSLTALSILGLLPARIGVDAGRIAFEGRDLLATGASHMRRIRGARIAAIFQEPMGALNPLMPIGEQVAEPLRTHRRWSSRSALARAEVLLRRVGIADARQRLRQFPFELSGGMCQRVMIAMALACEPSLLIADEPTTALDVTIQAQIVDLLMRLRRESGLSLLLITHDLGLAATLADRIHVLYAGRVVEHGASRAVLTRPAHPYTCALLQCVPRLSAVGSRLEAIPGAPPDPADPPTGCRFHPRCAAGRDIPACALTEPTLAATGNGTAAACWAADSAGPAAR